jgi:hypothetical protein
MPGIGYDHPNQSHFTSRHFWEVGAADERLSTGWLGRYLDRVGKPDNPLQGLSLDWSLQPSLATARMPVAAVDSPDRYDFSARGVWGDVSDRMVDTISRLGAIRSDGDPGLEAASDAARQSARLYDQLTPFRPKDDRQTRHTRQPGAGSRGRPQARGRLAPRLPERSRGAWARRPRARACVDRVRPPGEGERVRWHRSWLRRDGLPDRVKRGRNDDRSAVALVVVPLAMADTSTPARVQASADEFDLTDSRASIRSGPAIIELVNYGEDDHDLALRRVGGTRTYRIGIVHPGKTGELETRLLSGRFVVWCTLADHRSRGMRATLRVTP